MKINPFNVNQLGKDVIVKEVDETTTVIALEHLPNVKCVIKKRENGRFQANYLNQAVSAVTSKEICTKWSENILRDHASTASLSINSY